MGATGRPEEIGELDEARRRDVLLRAGSSPGTHSSLRSEHQPCGRMCSYGTTSARLRSRWRVDAHLARPIDAAGARGKHGAHPIGMNCVTCARGSREGLSILSRLYVAGELVGGDDDE